MRSTSQSPGTVQTSGGGAAAWQVPVRRAPMLLAAVALALTGCSAAGTSAASGGHATRVLAVTRAGVASGRTVTRHVAAPAPSCDPTASLRPSGPPAVPAGSYMATIRRRGYLIAGIDQNEFHFGYLNPLNGQIEGFDIDMVRAVAKAIFGSPDKIQFKALTDDQRIPAIRSGEVDIVAHSMTITCERWQLVDFSTVYIHAGQRILVEKNSPVRGIKDLGGKKVCATTGSTSIATIEAARPRPVAVAEPFWTDCLVLLQQGQVAAISTDDVILAGLAAQDPFTKLVGPRFTNEPHGLAISQQHPDFVRFVNAVLQQMRTDGRWAASYARWVGTPVPPPPPARYKD